MDLQAAIDDYLLDCSIKLSPHTLRWYREKLETFAESIGDEPITPPAINKFLRGIQRAPSTRTGKPLSSYTLHGYAQVIKSFTRWCAEEQNGYLPKAPHISMPTVDEKIIQTFTDAQVRQLLAVTTQEETPALVHRDRALLLFLLDTGVRAGEACGLTLTRLRLPDASARVIGKGRKERDVFFGKQARVALHRYLTRYRRGDGEEVFTGKRGQPMTVSGIDQMLYRLGGWAGVEGVRCSAHTLRHTYAVNYLMRGGDVYALSRLLGHNSVSTTEIYLKALTTRQLRGQGTSLMDDLLTP